MTKMTKFTKLILATAAAIFTFASCSSHDSGPAPVSPPADDGSVYSTK